MTYTVRPMAQEDVPALSELLNHTIRLGGTTAYEEPFDAAAFAKEFLTTSLLVSSNVATTEDGTPIGFQVLYAREEDGERFVSIASFTDQRVRYSGAGQALFPVTLAAALAHGATFIRAKIRGDNVPGLKYYRGLGFRDHTVRPQVPLKDGTPVDRVETRYPLT